MVSSKTRRKYRCKKSTCKNNRRKKYKHRTRKRKTRKRLGGNKFLKLGAAALALGLSPAQISANERARQYHIDSLSNRAVPSIATPNVSNDTFNNSTEVASYYGEAQDNPFAISNDYSWNADNTFSGDGTFTPIPSFETQPYNFPDANTTTVKPPMGMNLDPDKNCSVTVKSIANPTFPGVGSYEPFTHHTLEVQEVNQNNELLGTPGYVGYYAKATPESIQQYQSRPGKADRFKLNDNSLSGLMNPVGSPGHWQTPDAIVESGLAARNPSEMKTVGTPKIVSGEKFNKHLGSHVNLDVQDKYSAPTGFIKEGLQKIVGTKTANSVCGIGNCRSEAYDMMDKFGGRKSRRRKSRRRKSHRRKSRRRKSRRRKSRKRKR